jgi:hypothetical protein
VVLCLTKQITLKWWIFPLFYNRNLFREERRHISWCP